MVKNRIFTLLTCVFTVLLTITFSIGLPIYFRPFYYAHIKLYNLEEVTGKNDQQIKEAYNEVLDYLTLPGKEFGTGDFDHSEEGKNHFVDCKVLFDLNITVFFISVLILGLLFLLNRKKIFYFSKPFGRHFTVTTGGFTLGFFAFIVGLAALDFDKAFVVFHKIFFYGKDNWLFDYETDEIILALPQEFFLNCGILISASIIIISIFLIFFGLISDKKRK